LHRVVLEWHPLPHRSRCQHRGKRRRHFGRSNYKLKTIFGVMHVKSLEVPGAVVTNDVEGKIVQQFVG
jgi:hypothetical protein